MKPIAKIHYHIYISSTIILLFALCYIAHQTYIIDDLISKDYKETAKMKNTIRNIIVNSERMDMYDYYYIQPKVINGIYFNEQFYCVWTGDRDVAEAIEKDPSLEALNRTYNQGSNINTTAFHELVHHAIQMQYDHFCNDTGGVEE